ncbi:hypothetical protein [Candidatus Aalborgicola defluviihabitans]|uniref:hypothetical protein n=1 Tax=Candidatus Aalborgicola defluviihabitans TaxID=3386187 RepID=UPI001ECC72F3|nr:hypothetical protein [Burkholderiales bacterium]
MYNATRVDDRIEKFTSIEELPKPVPPVNGSWVEETEKQVKNASAPLRKEFKKAHPDAAKDSGPSPTAPRLTCAAVAHPCHKNWW